ncbi:hypothetical protein U9M48_020838 [Paspalum notatum var. saurae]|uniref:Uncharacterized protein n=1 Tax=Paspalum notatum var. saurae TaxID=547442 RepID=A0AAQ3TH33_PASNO
MGQLPSQFKQAAAAEASSAATGEVLVPVATPLHNFDEIAAQAETTANRSQLEEQATHGGVLLAQKKKKYWVQVHGGTRCNCFMLFPRGLSITWGDDPSYWTWKKLLPGETGDDPDIEVASLLDVCWLEIHGKLELSHLTPGVNYNVAFEVKLADGGGSGWSRPVNLRLKFPDGPVQERKELLRGKPANLWLQLKVGEIQPRQGQRGEILISLFEYGGHWKSGLIVKGIKIAPKE